MLQIFCFGTPRLVFAQDADPPPTLMPKALALFVYLAVTAAKDEPPASRDQLADLLWSATNNQQALDNLRYLLPQLRRSLQAYLVITTRSISFNRQAPTWSDVAQLYSTLTAHPETLTTAALQAALDLYRGEFLAGFRVRNTPVFEEWSVRQREELHALAVQGAYTLAERYWQQGAYAQGLTATRRLFTWEPWHEGGHRLQMQLLAASGQRAAAVTHYERCCTILADELGAPPDAATTALYEQIRDGVYDPMTRGQDDRVTSLPGQGDTAIESPPHPVILPGQALSPPHNLPSQLTSFLGRQRDVTELCNHLLSPDYRLITLVGEGGVGKTRLALRVAQAMVAPGGTSESLSRQERPFPDGIWFVSLVGLRVAGDAANAMAAAIGEAVGLHFAGGERLTNQLCAQLQHRRLLLVLDNFEHLVAAADFLIDLLCTAPAVKILVTSRQWLNFQAELVWRVEGLPVPPPAAELAEAALAHYESVALFCVRARALKRTFRLNAANRGAIVRICQLVAGLPLALELAASLSRRHDCAEILALLQADYTRLAATHPDLPVRHRRMDTVLGASWALLSAAEAQILAQCAVFCGSFSREAVQAVTGATLLQLEALESKSLLHQVQPGRYTSHELVRQYSATQLQTWPVLHRQTSDRHRAYYLAWLRSQGDALHIDAEAQQRIRLEHDNLLAAWQQAITTVDLAGLANGLPALARFYCLAGYYGAGLALCQAAGAGVQAALVAAPDTLAQRTLAQLLLAQAAFCHNLGRLGAANDYVVEALAFGHQLADEQLIAQAHYEMAEVARLGGQAVAAQEAVQQALTLARKCNDVALEVASLNRYGVILMNMADFGQATACFHAALALLPVTPDRVLEARLLLNVGHASQWQRQWGVALAYNQRGYALAAQFGDQRGVGLACYLLGMVWKTIGEFAQAHSYYEQAHTIFHQANMAFFEGVVLAFRGHLWHEAGDYQAAHQCYEAALQINQSIKAPLLDYFVHTYFGHLLVALHQFDEAERAYTHAMRLPLANNQDNKALDAAVGLAALYLAQNNGAAALAQVETILPHLPLSHTTATVEMHWVHWTCYCVLKRVDDGRAPALLQQAYQSLCEQAATIHNPQHRHAFWQKVATHRNMRAEAQAVGLIASAVTGWPIYSGAR